MRILTHTFSVVLVSLAQLAHADETSDRNLQFFERRIRPVLVEHCYECHSAGSTQVQGGLRVDFRDGLLSGGDSGPAIVPGRPTDGSLISALRHESFEMPPTGKLSDTVIQDFVRWIEGGADDPRTDPPSSTAAAEAAWKARLAERSRWWSLQPPRRHSPPEVEELRWSHDPVDRFILAKLQESGLSPAEPADAETLLRRLSFVLTGLPPTPQQVIEFRTSWERDPDAALDALVDQLLESPHFGERFARHWMDVVRYTDTYGYEWDNPAKGSWEYRDYLIRAFNEDIGFDQLIREQIAGDLLSQPRINPTEGVNESLIGPMFYHMGEHRHGSSLDFNGIHQEMIDNKIDAFSKAFLGMTVACARCHDHKLDAVSQADYYALAGMLMTPRWTPRAIDASPQRKELILQLKQLREEILTALSEAWQAPNQSWASGSALRQWVSEHHAALNGAKPDDISFPFDRLLHQEVWLKPQGLTAAASSKPTNLVIGADETILAEGEIPETDTYKVSFSTPPGNVSLLRLEALTHDSLGSRGPGRTPHGNFVLSQLRVQVTPHLAPDGTPGETRELSISSARSDYAQPNYPAEAALDPAPTTGWAVGLGGNVDRTAWFSFADPVELPHGGEWTVTLDHNYGSSHILGRFRITLGVEAAALAVATRDAMAVETWGQLASQWRADHESRQRSMAETFQVLTDFSEPGFPAGWVTDGDGIEHGYVSEATPLVALDGELLIARLLPRGYHTHALSSKLPGAVRLPPPERFPRTRISVQLAGGEWAGRQTVPQNAFLTEGPVFFDPAKPPTWTTIAPVGLSNGVTRVLTEIATSSLHPNFPPRTGVARMGNVTLPDEDEGFDKRSWFSVTGIVAHDAAATPPELLHAFETLYGDGSEPATSEAVWQRLADWLDGSVERWSRNEPKAGDVRILNWMLSQHLLPNDAQTLPAVSSLVQRYRELESQLAFPRSVNSLDERAVEPVNYRLNIRGNVNEEGPAIPHGFLEVFSEARAIRESTGSGRLELAEYLSSPNNPVTARVYVNRVWQWVFGKGLVPTSSDFGKLGETPSHPELLDWLALEFMDDGWSTKHLVRRLVRTLAFRQSGDVSPQGKDRDPENLFWHHYPTRRLEAEAIRDSLLAVSGRLDPQFNGHPINPPRTVEDAKKRLFSGPLDGNGRRSLYLEMSIMDPPKFLVGFNLPDLKLPTGRRDVTNVPAQALIMLNDPLVTTLAEFWGDRIISDGLADPRQRLQQMFLAALGRYPTTAELDRWTGAVQELSLPSADLMHDKQAWTGIAHALFNTKEFIYFR